MELKDTVELMNSKCYKDRFKAEYAQTKIRYERLKNYNNEIEAAYVSEGKLTEPPHSCPFSLLRDQQRAMGEYLHTLELRAKIEHIDL